MVLNNQNRIESKPVLNAAFPVANTFNAFFLVSRHVGTPGRGNKRFVLYIAICY